MQCIGKCIPIGNGGRRGGGEVNEGRRRWKVREREWWLSFVKI